MRLSARPSPSRRRLLRRRPRPHVVHVLAPLNGQLGDGGGGYVNVALELLRPMMSVAEDRSSERGDNPSDLKRHTLAYACLANIIIARRLGVCHSFPFQISAVQCSILHSLFNVTPTQITLFIDYSSVMMKSSSLLNEYLVLLDCCTVSPGAFS